MSNDFNKRASFVIAVCTSVALAVALVWMTRVILLVLFAGLIGALFLSILTEYFQVKFKLHRNVAFATVLVAFGICMGLGIWIRGPALVQQFSDLQIDLPAAVHRILAQLQGQSWGRWLLSRYTGLGPLSGGLLYAFTRIGGAVVTTASVLVGLFVVASVSLYVAAEPALYSRGLHRLTPQAHRMKVDACLGSATQMLRSWLVAKAISMVGIGLFVSAGLWALGIPLAGTLGIIAGLLTFIPNLGPVLSFLPAALLAFAISPTKGMLTILLFCVAHFLEGNLLTPLIERHIVRLPPALTLAVQLLLAMLAGALGVALAAPITAVMLGVLQVILPPKPVQDDTAQRKDDRDCLRASAGADGLL